MTDLSIKEIAGKLEDLIPDCEFKFVDDSGEEPYFQVDCDEVLIFCTQIRDFFDTLIDIVCIDYVERKSRFELVYLFSQRHGSLRSTVRTRFSAYDAVPSLMRVFPAADWFEREVFDLYGVTFRGHKNLTRLFTSESVHGFPFRKDYGENQTGVRPDDEDGMHEVREGLLGRFSFVLDRKALVGNEIFSVNGQISDDRVSGVSCSVGEFHLGFEKKCEDMSYSRIHDELLGLANGEGELWAILFIEMIERAIGLKVSPNDSMARECHRHLVKVTQLMSSLSRVAEFFRLPLKNVMRRYQSQIQAYREKWQLTSENRWNKLGGINVTETDGWKTQLSSICETLVEVLDTVSEHFESFLVRRRLRSVGINDSQKESHDLHSLLLGKVEDARGMVEYIQKTLLQVDLEGSLKFEEPSEWENETLQIPPGTIYHHCNTAEGEMGIFLVSEGGHGPYRLKVRGPSLPIIQSFPKIFEGQCIEDLPLITSCYALNSFEVDR